MNHQWEISLFGPLHSHCLYVGGLVDVQSKRSCLTAEMKMRWHLFGIFGIAPEVVVLTASQSQRQGLFFVCQIADQ